MRLKSPQEGSNYFKGVAVALSGNTALQRAGRSLQRPVLSLLLSLVIPVFRGLAKTAIPQGGLA